MCDDLLDSGTVTSSDFDSQPRRRPEDYSIGTRVLDSPSDKWVFAHPPRDSADDPHLRADSCPQFRGVTVTSQDNNDMERLGQRADEDLASTFAPC